MGFTSDDEFSETSNYIARKSQTLFSTFLTDSFSISEIHTNTLSISLEIKMKFLR